MVLIKRLIGQGVTDVNGECSVSYVGKGTGILNIKSEAPERMIQSETYSIDDCIYYDDTTSDKTSTFTNTNGALTFSTDKYVLTRNANGECYTQYLIDKNLVKGKTIRFKCNIVEADASVFIRIYKQVNGSFVNARSDSATSGLLTVDFAIDDTATMCFFRIVANNLGSGQSVSFNNLEVLVV